MTAWLLEDIPDEFQMKRSEKSTGPDGTKRWTEVSYRRRDLQPGDVVLETDLVENGFLPDGEEDLPDGKVIREEKVLPDGTRVTRVKSTVAGLPGTGKEKAAVREMLKDFMDPSEIEEMLGEAEWPDGKAGVEHEISKSRTVSRTIPSGGVDEDRSFVIYSEDPGGMTGSMVKLAVGAGGVIVFLLILLALFR